MDSIRNFGNKANNWLKSNVLGDKKDYVPVDHQAQKILDKYEKLGEKIEQSQQNLENVCNMSELKPPSLSDISDKKLVTITTLGGAAVGGAMGMAMEVVDVALNDPKIEVTETKYDIQRPVLTGFDEKMHEHKDSGGLLLGYDHKFTPRIEYKNEGSYTVPKATVTNSANVNSPVIEGFKGMVAGGAIGGAAGIAICVGRKVLHKGEYEPRPDREIEGEGKVIAATTVAGAAGGAILGAIGAASESANNVTQELKWKEPVIGKTTIGQVPQDHYHSAYNVVEESTVPKRDVVVDSPKMEKGTLGIGEKPVMQEKTELVETGKRFGFAGQVLGGAVLGAIGGAFTGVVFNTLRKIL